MDIGIDLKGLPELPNHPAEILKCLTMRGHKLHCYGEHKTENFLWLQSKNVSCDTDIKKIDLNIYKDKYANAICVREGLIGEILGKAADIWGVFNVVQKREQKAVWF